ncbi:MAG: MFS transporter [Deltaproteobacteria bacterium]|nr:MAG: MFS transporter [Deltaproteobacteria bacterium]
MHRFARHNAGPDARRHPRPTMVKIHVEESLGANPGDAALNPADPVAMGVPATLAPGFLGSSSGRAFRALVHRPYRLLFAAFLVNQTGFWISHVSMQGLMVGLSHNRPIWLGLLFFFLFIPAFALAPLAGVAADRYDRKRIMFSSYGLVAALSAALAAFTALNWITAPGLLALALALGTCFAFAGPASFALAANAVPDADMPSAVSLQSAANNLTRVVGPVAATPFVANGHFEWSFLTFMVAALCAAVLIGLMRVTPYEAEPEDGGILSRLAVGFVHARERRPALPALAMVATLSLFGVSHSAILSVFAEHELGSARYFPWMVVATGAGAMLGALSIGYRSRGPSMQAAAVLMLGYSAAMAVFSSARALPLALGSQFVIGWTYFAVMTSLQTLIQSIVHESKRGRVMALFQVAWAGLVPWGGLGMGAAASAIGETATLAAAAGVCAVYAAGALIWARSSLALEPAPDGGLY